VLESVGTATGALDDESGEEEDDEEEEVAIFDGRNRAELIPSAEIESELLVEVPQVKRLPFPCNASTGDRG
jgi:hypothetical protein